MQPILSHTLIFPDLKPFSINATYSRTQNGVFKSSGATEFCAQLFNVMGRSENQQKLQELRTKFDPKLHAYALNIVCFYEPEMFFTKKGDISSRTLDISNCEKLIVDALMLPKYHEESEPYGAPNLNCDDKMLVQMISTKLPAHKAAIRVDISIVDKPTLCLE